MIQALFLALHALSCAPQIPIPERPRDPWVFRSVLDQRPRIVTIALSSEMWVAYDTETCGMYKCWKGGVEFKGAVYTSVHGDQPTSLGESYTRGAEGRVWSALVAGKEVPVRARWRGYFIHDGRAHLEYEIVLPDGRRIDLQETPEYASTEQVLGEPQMEDMALVHGMPVLYRSWLVEAIPDDVVIMLKLRTDSDTLRQRLTFPEGVLMREETVDEEGADGVLHHHFLSLLPFRKDLLGANIGVFYDPLPDPEPARPKDTKSADSKPGTPPPAKPTPEKRKGG